MAPSALLLSLVVVGCALPARIVPLGSAGTDHLDKVALVAERYPLLLRGVDGRAVPRPAFGSPRWAVSPGRHTLWVRYPGRRFGRGTEPPVPARVIRCFALDADFKAGGRYRLQGARDGRLAVLVNLHNHHTVARGRLVDRYWAGAGCRWPRQESPAARRHG